MSCHRNLQSFLGIPEPKRRLLAISPFEKPDVSLCCHWIKSAGIAAVDIGRDSGEWPEVLRKVACDSTGMLGVRIPDHVAIHPEQIPCNCAFLVLTAEKNLALWRDYPCIVQVSSVQEARASVRQGAIGLIAKGRESGGKVGDESTYILLQRLLGDDECSVVPVWAQGGIGLHSAAAVIAGGAMGVVLDSQLALMAESTLSKELKELVVKLEGTESRVVQGYAVYSRPGPGDDELAGLSPEQLREAMACGRVLALGQDAALANEKDTLCRSCESLGHHYRVAITGHLRQARALSSLAAHAPLAQLHGTRYPIAQGPMTRVSDTAEFARAVADNGALPFLALSLMNRTACDALLAKTQSLLGQQSWGVGVLGFAPPEVLNPQLELISHYKPKVVLVAGGRPSQARALEEQGMQAYLHVPAPGLLEMFLKDGARSFVFEGQECGGHIGPRFSFVLWEQQINRLLRFERPQELNILFAGGIHDERSAAMVAALAAPLAARGAKIGVLMGSAYIATEEAVQTGAVNAVFQQRVINSEHTVLLETAPGHAIRGLDTAFAQYFQQEKQKLIAQGLDKKEIWARLEALNLGRLRLATKGLERVSGDLIERDEQTQLESGMYMIGQLAAMCDRVCKMADLHHAVTDAANTFLQRVAMPELTPPTQHQSIAIVGMECIYPGSPDLESYWLNILEGNDLVREVSAERWNSSLYYSAQPGEKGSTPSKWGGFIDDYPFNPLDYGIPPQSLAAIEPVQMLSLEVAKRALLDAGYAKDLNDLPREKVSVIFGAESGHDLSGAYNFRNYYKQYLGDIPAELDAVLPSLTEDSFPGVLVNVIAGRIANRLDLGGVNYTVDSACASSLTAVELAVKELRTGSSDVVLAGGADFHNGINDFLMFASVTALSASGKCKSFDNQADGIALGEGVGVVVLKRLEDAERDGDRIYAVIDGIAGSSDGKSLGLTAPRKEGQKRALERAYQQAGVLAGDIGLVEAHGTGTVVGDKTELATLTEIYNQGGALTQQTVLGSVKSQIGHTKCAAGIAGLIKISKALYHRILPPTQNIQNPNTYYQPENSPFTLDNKPRPWLHEKPRAAISAFGFGGTNFHAVLSACDNHLHPATTGHTQWQAELFVFRGERFDDAVAQMDQLALFLDTDVRHALRDLSFSVWQSAQGPVQCVLVAEDIAQLRELLVKAKTRQGDRAICYRNVADAEQSPPGKIAFLFPGQGSQTPGMLRDLFVAFPQLRSLLVSGREWLDKLYPPTAYDAVTQRAQQQAITDTRVAQPTLGIADMAMATVLAELGLSADMLAGLSYGELVALAVAECFDLDTLLRLSKARGEAIVNAAGDDPGKMAAVSASAAEVSQALVGIDGVVLANLNSPRQTVISGSSEAIEKSLVVLKTAGMAAQRLEVACAFHSPQIARAERLFAEQLKSVTVRPLQKTVYSNRTAAAYPTSEAAIKHELAAHVVSPTRFVEQIEAMYAAGARTFIEVGPGRALSGMVDAILGDKPHHTIATDRKGVSGIGSLLQAVAQLLCLDININLDYLYRGRKVKMLDLQKPVSLAKSTWWVNGARAKPLTGTLPAHAAVEITEPVQVQVQIAASAANAQVYLENTDANEQVVAQYLNNVRDMVFAQRDVMLSMFGSAPSTYTSASVAVTPKVQPHAVAASSVVTAGNVVPFEKAPGKSAQTNTGKTPTPDLQQSLINIVSDRTGYPAEMLELDLDLEADLSIDSIKRVEIVGQLVELLGFREQLGADVDQLMEQLAARKTLGEILVWLKSHLSQQKADGSASTASADIASANTFEANALRDSATNDAHAVNVQALLLDIVSERTGYPQDVLELDLDLEADLSIDSIKRLEIVGELAERLGLDALVADKDAAMENLAALKTLRAMVEWLDAQAPQLSVTVGEQPVRTEASDTAELQQNNPTIDNEIALSRYLVKATQVADAVKGSLELKDKTFLITDDQLGIAQRLKTRLESHGASVSIVGFQEEDAIPGEFGVMDGLIHLSGLNPRTRVRDVKRFFELARNGLMNDISYLLVASGLGGSFGHYREQQQLRPEGFGLGGGTAGMVKTIAKECSNVRAHWVDLDLDESVDELATYLELELLAENPLTEVGYQAGVRRGAEVIEAALSDADNNHLNLDRDSVVLITGGAQGITARVAVELARRFGCKLELVGRSALPEGAEPVDIARAEDLISLRKVIISQHKGLTPAEVGKLCSRILSARAILKTLDEVRQAGGQVRYHSLDVRNIDAFEQLIKRLYQEHGRIDGVIHGAGVVEDKLLRHKTAESFERVFDTKVRAALMLAKLIRDDVRFVVFFSSVAGAFGNRGQVDYASANDALDKIAHSLQMRVKGRVLSVNWGPWAGQGMVSEELEREYARKGIGLIPLTEGVEALLKELKHGARDDTQVVLMCASAENMK